MLDVEIRSPILRIGRVLFSEAGEPLLYTMAQYRSDRYQIRLDLHSFGDHRDGDGLTMMSPVPTRERAKAEVAAKASGPSARPAKIEPARAKAAAKSAKGGQSGVKVAAVVQTPSSKAPKTPRPGKASRTARVAP